MNTQAIRPPRWAARSLAIFVAFALALGGALVATAAPAHAASAFSITGTLTGKTAAGTSVPLADVYVYLYQRDADGYYSSTDYGDYTSATGAFVVEAPAAGAYTLLYNYCASPTTASCNYAYTGEYYGDAQNTQTATAISLTAAAPTKAVNLQVEAASTITGTVKTSAGVGMAGVRVSANRPGDYNGPSATTSSTGTYTIPRVATKDTLLWATYYDDTVSSNKDRKFYNSIYWKNSLTEAGATPLAITVGSTKTGVDFTLTEAPSIRGRVVDATGDPIPYIGYTFYQLNKTTGAWQGPQSGPNVTDASGWFSRPVTPSSTYRWGYFDDLEGEGQPITRTTPYASKFYKNAATFATATDIAVGATSRIVLDDTVLTPFSGAIKMVSPYRIVPEDSDATLLFIDSQLFSPQDITTTRQWYRDGVAISGATDYSYRYVAADKGAVITQKVTASRAGSTSATFTSDPFTVPGSTLTASPVPTITGTTTVGKTLTANAGTWTPAPVNLSYAWRRNGTAISGATASTYVLTTADAGAKITVSVKGTKTGYYRVTKTSAATAAVAAAPLVLTSATPTISGTPKVASKLTAVPGAWAPTPVAFKYQWYVDGAAISGATASTYSLPSAQLGKSITVKVTGSKTGYTSVAKTSAAVVVAAATFTPGTPTISGTAAVGVKLTAAKGTWSPTTSATFSYQWLRTAVGSETAVAISGATASTYTVASAYKGQTISVKVTAKRTGFTTASATSAVTKAVLGKLTAPTPAVSGTAKVGKTLTAKVGTWTTGTVLTYEWLRTKSGVTKVIAGAKSKTYKLTSTSKAATIKVRVTGKLDGYRSSVVSSKATAKVS